MLYNIFEWIYFILSSFSPMAVSAFKKEIATKKAPRPETAPKERQACVWYVREVQCCRWFAVVWFV
jgi:hypothetical protein